MSKFQPIKYDSSSLNKVKRKRTLTRSDGRSVRSTDLTVPPTDEVVPRPTAPPASADVSQVKVPETAVPPRSGDDADDTEGALVSRKKPKTTDAAPSKGKEKVSAAGSSPSLPPPPPGVPPPQAAKIPAAGGTTPKATLKATEVEKVKSGLWRPEFGTPGGRALYNESSILHDELDAWEFIKGMGTPRDKRYLDGKSGQLRHNNASWHLLKGLMFHAANDNLIEQTTRRLHGAEKALERSVARGKELEAELQVVSSERDQLKSHQTQADALKSQIKALEDKLKGATDKVKRLQAASEVQASELTLKDKSIQVLSDQLVVKDQKLAGLAEEVKVATALQQSEVEEARAFYQKSLEEQVAEVYLKGQEVGYADCLEEYGIVDPSEVRLDDEGNIPIGILHPSLLTTAANVSSPADQAIVALIPAEPTPVPTNEANAPAARRDEVSGAPLQPAAELQNVIAPVPLQSATPSGELVVVPPLQGLITKGGSSSKAKKADQ